MAHQQLDARASQTWTVLTDDLPTTGGGSVAFGRNPNTLYLGLGDPYDQILVGGAMTKSKNGGVSWGPMIELGNAVSVRDVKVDTSTNRDIVLVATDNGLYRSADDGRLVQRRSPTFAGLSVWSIVRTSAGWLASAQPCPAPAAVGLRCGVSHDAVPVDRSRRHVGADLATPATSSRVNGRTTLARGCAGRRGRLRLLEPRRTMRRCRDVYRSADGGQTWVANNVNATKIPTNPVIAGSMPT